MTDVCPPDMYRICTINKWSVQKCTVHKKLIKIVLISVVKYTKYSDYKLQKGLTIYFVMLYIVQKFLSKLAVHCTVWHYRK